MKIRIRNYELYVHKDTGRWASENFNNEWWFNIGITYLSPAEKENRASWQKDKVK